MEKIRFPKDFIFGTATSAAQLEGAAGEDGSCLLYTSQQPPHSFFVKALCFYLLSHRLHPDVVHNMQNIRNSINQEID